MSGRIMIVGFFLFTVASYGAHAISYLDYHKPLIQDLKLTQVSSPEDQIQVKVSGKLALCNHFDRGSVSLEVTGGVPPYDFTWSNLEKGPIRNNLYAGTYTVFIKDSKGNEHEERIVVQPPFPLIVDLESIKHASCGENPEGEAKINILFGRGEPYKVIWSHGLEGELEASKLSPGTYSVKVIDQFSCDATISFEILSQEPSFEVTEEIQGIGCNDGTLGAITLEVSGGQAPYKFLWSHGESTKDVYDLEEGIYEVEIADQTGCTITKEFEIVSSGALEVKVTRVQHNICGGKEQGEIDVEVTGGIPPYSFNWSNGSKDQNLKNLEAGIYILQVFDAHGCGLETQVEVEESEILTARINTSIEVDCLTGEAVGYAWVDIEGGKSPYLIKWPDGQEGKNEIEFKSSTEVWVEVLDGYGCSVREKMRVDFPFDYSISNRLNFDFRKLTFSSETEIQVLEPVVFESEISDEFIAWEWDFGDGETANEKSPMHIFSDPGAYEVVLKGFDIYGCSTSQSRTINVMELEEWVTMPNAFTPNGDGLNDVFSPVLKGIIDFEMDIFSHWGEHLYSEKGLELTGWDGSYKGQLLPRGNYVYKIQYSTVSGKTVHKTGSVSLLR